MDSSRRRNFLTLRIIGLSLDVSVISYIRMSRQRDLVRTDRRAERRNIVRAPANGSGSTAVSRG